MKAELWNLYLFALAIGKAAGMTLLGPGVLFVYAVEKWASANRVPARNQGERWLVWKLRKSSSTGIPTLCHKASTLRAISARFLEFLLIMISGGKALKKIQARCAWTLTRN